MITVAESDYYGMYEYKGFTIWCPNEKEWIAEPDWSIKAIENFKAKGLPKHKTIAKAKKCFMFRLSIS